MRINATSGAARRPADSGSRAGAAAPFGLGAACGPAAPASGLGPVSPAGLLALQDVAPGAGERRRRALGRGRGLLDRLDQLRLGLLAGAVPAPLLARLRADLEATVPAAGDPVLDRILAAIDLRCAVEIAKLDGHGPPP